MLEDDPARAISLPELAAADAVTPKHLCRLLRDVHRSHAHGDRPLGQAREVLLLLARTDLTVQEVARTSGFASPYHFSRAFRAAYGLPPSRVRDDRRPTAAEGGRSLRPDNDGAAVVLGRAARSQRQLEREQVAGGGSARAHASLPPAPDSRGRGEHRRASQRPRSRSRGGRGARRGLRRPSRHRTARGRRTLPPTGRRRPPRPAGRIAGSREGARSGRSRRTRRCRSRDGIPLETTVGSQPRGSKPPRIHVVTIAVSVASSSAPV